LAHAVVDAFVVVDLLVAHPRAPAGRAALDAVDAVAPALIDAEVLHALTRYVRRGDMTEERAQQALQLLAEAPIERFPIAPLVLDAWAYATTSAPTTASMSRWRGFLPAR
jgi:predicted nucleic acid-binding protein